MKITINKTITQDIEIPPYFTIDKSYYMLVDENKAYVRITNFELNSVLWLFPQINMQPISALTYEISEMKYPIVPISEAVFKNEYLRTSLNIEKICN